MSTESHSLFTISFFGIMIIGWKCYIILNSLKNLHPTFRRYWHIVVMRPHAITAYSEITEHKYGEKELSPKRV